MPLYPMSSQLSQVSQDLYDSSQMAQERTYMMPSDILGADSSPFAGSASASLYEAAMLPSARALGSLEGAIAMQQAALERQEKEWLLYMGAGVLGAAAGAVTGGKAALPVWIGATELFKFAGEELGWLDQAPVASWEDQIRGMVAGDVHRLAFEVAPMPGESRGITRADAQDYGDRMYDSMREAGFHGAEFGRIANVMSSSGALDGSRSTEEVMDRMEQYIERMAEFVKRTGMSIEQTEPYIGMMGNMGSSFDSMADMVVSTQRMSFHSGIGGEQLMQGALQANAPWASMGVPYGDAVHESIMNIAMARDSYSMSGQQMAWQQAGGFESVAMGYEARGANFMADPGILRWMGAAGPEGMEQILSGDKMPTAVTNELNRMSREDRLMAEYYGSLQASMDPGQWGDAYMARLVGHMEDQKIFDPRAQAIQLTNMGIYATRAEATAALDLYADRTDPGTQYRDTFSILTGIQQEEGINLSQIGMSGLGVGLAVAREHFTTAGLNLSRGAGESWSSWMAQEGIVDDPRSARYLATVQAGEQVGASGDIGAYANNPGYLGGGILFSGEGRGGTLYMNQIADVLNDPNLSDSERAQLVEIYNNNLAGQGSPRSWERGLDARSLSAQINEIGIDDSGRVYFDVNQESTSTSWGAAGRVGQSGVWGLEDRGELGIAGGIHDVLGYASGALGGLGNRVFGGSESRRYYADEGFDNRSIIVSGIDPSALYGMAEDFEALAHPAASVPEWFGASRNDAVVLGAMQHMGVSGLLGDNQAISGTLGVLGMEVDIELQSQPLAHSQASRALEFAQQQFDPEALRTTTEIINSGDAAWDDLKKRLDSSPSAWTRATEGRNSSSASDRYEAVDQFAMSLYNKSWNALDPSQQQAVNYYLGIQHQEWGMQNDEVTSDAMNTFMETAQQSVSQAVARSSNLVDQDQARDAVRALTRTTGRSEEELGTLSEYMFLETTVRGLESQRTRTTEEESLLRSARSQMQSMESDRTIFTDAGGIRGARDRYGTEITGFGGELIEGQAELGMMVALRGREYIQAREQIISDFETDYNLGEGTARRILEGGTFGSDEIAEMRGLGVSSDILNQLQRHGSAPLAMLAESAPSFRNRETGSNDLDNRNTTSPGADGAALGGSASTAIYTRDVYMEQALDIFRAIAGKIRIQSDESTPTDDD